MDNRERVREFVELVFNQHRLECVPDYVRADYIQHNPNVATGRDAFIQAFEKMFAVKPGFHQDIKHLIVDGDFVVVHAHATSGENDAGTAVADIYRLQDGMLAEHWDVLQKIPDHFVHDNGMF